ncbi:PAS domain S-box protein [Candidatus Methylobacter oryzae]|uniref:histidine kinase n=1 Tax=Candidatus Methylobacter oryzae TaxID=2497749 RepID=A0ABY3CB48_9GAMM|nr:PAS domain S-box protein [Candidatus Methylobacter oryzae]TRW95265.1 PAS domain S-box protein [Candidatus Methylobacter oryzae]
MTALTGKSSLPGSFKRQIILAFVVGSFCLISAFAAYMIKTESVYRYQDANSTTLGVAQSLAVSSRSWVLANDLMGLQEVVNAFQAYPELRYAMVISPSGRVIAHSDRSKVGLFLSDASSLALLKAPVESRVVAATESGIDVAVPIEIDKRYIGWARVAVGRNGIAGELRKMLIDNTVFVLLATMLSLLAATVIAKRLGARIGLLMQAAEEVQAGNVNTRAHIPGRGDEISMLADNFNRMLDVLAENEKQLRTASLYTRSLIEASLDPLVTISPEGIITDVNYATEQVTGKSRAELIGTDFSGYFTEPDKARDGYLQAFFEGSVTDCPLAIRHQDGHITDVLYNASVYRDEAGQVLGVFAAARDITESKQAEAMRTQLAAIVESSNDAIVGKTPDGIITHWNKSAERIYGYTAEEIIGKPVTMLAPASRYNEIHEFLGKTRMGETVVNRESERIRKDGALINVALTLSPIKDAFGSITGISTIVRDITERKQNEAVNAARLHLVQFSLTHSLDELLEETLNETEKLTGSEIGFYHFVEEDQNTLTLQNWSTGTKARFCKAEGQDLHYAIADAGVWVDCIHQRKAVIHNDYASLPHRSGMPEGDVAVTRELVVPVMRGEKIAAILGVGNKPTDYLEKDVESVSLIAGLAWEIAERKRAEDEIHKLNQELEQRVVERTADLVLARNAAEAANQAKSVFLASMSHELRTPLNAILGFSNLMRKDMLLPENHRQNLDIINRSGEHLLALINDVLEMAKIEAGRVQLENIPLDLGGMVRDVTDMMQVRAEEKGLRMQVDQSSQFPRYIVGDEARLRQILINLIGNAVKFTQQGGVTLRLGTRQNSVSHLVIEIEDSGSGIASEDQQRIFEPFVQLGSQKDSKGSGLGLSITRQFVQLMGGNISLESKPGKGALFRIDLPLVEVMEADIAKAREVEKGDVVGLAEGQPEYRILIVEDQLENQVLLAKLMESVGFQVKVAENGEQGVQLFQSWHPHLIWMDRRMPVMDGLEATRAIRSLPGGKAVKIVAVTASAFIEQRAESLDAGMDGFVRKPYRFNEIYGCLSQQLGVRYIYEGAPEADKPGMALTSEMLAALPEALRSQLKDALENLESKRIASLIRQIAPIDLELHKVLAYLAENFDYPAILEALRETD